MSKKLTFFLFTIVVLGTLLRIYKLDRTLSFDTDQAAAYLIADRILSGKNLLLVGPLTTIWQVNLLPPTYYYLITLLKFFLQDELLITAFFTVTGILTVVLAFITGREISGKKAGLLSAYLTAVSVTMIQYSRNIWELHLIPFLILLSLYFIQKANRQGNVKYLWLSILTFCISLMYVSSFLLIPAMLFLWTAAYKKIKLQPGFRSFRKILIPFIFLLAAFYLPVLFFETFNGFPSVAYIINILTGQTGYVSTNLPSAFQNLIEHSWLFLYSLFPYLNGILILPLLLIFLIPQSFRKNRSSGYLTSKVLTVLILASLLLTSLYSGKAEVYRMASLYPFFFLIAGSSLNRYLIMKNNLQLKTVTYSLVLIFLSAFTIFNLKNYRFHLLQGNQLAYKPLFNAAKFILNDAGNASFTLYVITPFEKQNHHATPYYLALEKLTGEKLINLNQKGNWIDQNLQKKNWIYLICREYADMSTADRDCQEYFTRTYNLSQAVMKVKLDQEILYKIRGQS